jgi:uncharacterized damage-inducible protein DinB
MVTRMTPMDTGLIENYRLMAQYNRWINRRLYAACDELTDFERKQNRGAFFGSIHNTLNHLVWGDRVWLQRFAAQGYSFSSLAPELLTLPKGAVHGTVLYEEWVALRSERERLDAAIEDWTHELPADFPMRMMRYQNFRGAQREHLAWKALTHFFNHQTHHRGQVTTLLVQAGAEAGVTDLIALI